MKKAHLKKLVSLLTMLTALLLVQGLAMADEGEGNSSGEGSLEDELTEEPDAGLQRGGRMEFDGRLVRGETAGAGAVFLFERAPRALPSMVETRSSFLNDTVEQVFGEEEISEVEEKDSKSAKKKRRKK